MDLNQIPYSMFLDWILLFLLACALICICIGAIMGIFYSLFEVVEVVEVVEIDEYENPINKKPNELSKEKLYALIDHRHPKKEKTLNRAPSAYKAWDKMRRKGLTDKDFADWLRTNIKYKPLIDIDLEINEN